MDLINKENKTGVLMGDYNIDLLRCNEHNKINDHIDNIFSRGFMPLICKPTRVTRTSATLIDNIYTNAIDQTSSSGIIITDVADHFGTFSLVSEKLSAASNIPKYKRIFSEANIHSFKQFLQQTDFTEVTNIHCADESYNHFLSLYKNAFNRAFPLKLFRPNRKFIKRELWVTPGLLASSRSKAKLFHKKLKNPTDNNITRYKTFVNMFNKLKRIIKTNYYKDMITINRHDMKATWSILKQAIGTHKGKTNFPQSFIIDNNKTSDKATIATSFNKFFAGIGKSTGDNVPQANCNYSEYLKQPNPDSIFIEPVESHHILAITKKLKPKVSCGHDGISTKLVKETIDCIIQPLTYIINRSLDSGIVPNQLKVAKVIPIYKASDQSQLKNYRPISLLPAFSKIFEKVMYNKIIAFLDSKNLFYKHQYGFRSKHSTIHPILHLINRCAESNNKNPKEHTLSIFCDLSKAFDVISHDILIKKLNYYGIRGIANKWFMGYLSNRSQYVDIDGITSELESIICGVPQGSILGPLLYLIYVNDIAESTSESILSFADDTSVYTSHHDLPTLFINANQSIKHVFNWFCANRLSLNPTKTKYMVIHAPQKHCNFENLKISINGTDLIRIGSNSEEQTTKFLGIYMDEFLSWRYHVAHINTKISRALFAIKQTKNILPKESLKTLYFALIQPHINYGILAWGNSNATTLKKTITLQKRAIRLLNKASYNSHTDPLFRQSKILKVSDLYEHQVALFMHDYCMNKVPMSFDGIYKKNHGTQNYRPTRQSNLFHIERCDSSFSSKLPIYHFPRVWNKWARTFPDCTRRSQFKKELKETFLSLYAMNVKCQNRFCHDCYVQS